MPSWGYMVEHGATTIWERWDGWVEGRGFQNPGMNSFNHYAIGAVGEWMWRVIAGINPDESAPGYKHVRIRPIPGGGLTWARASYDSIRGRITSAWSIDGEGLSVDVALPPGVTATVEIPVGGDAVIEECGQPLERSEGVGRIVRGDTSTMIEVESGEYRFRAAAGPSQRARRL